MIRKSPFALAFAAIVVVVRRTHLLPRPGRKLAAFPRRACRGRQGEGDRHSWRRKWRSTSQATSRLAQPNTPAITWRTTSASRRRRARKVLKHSQRIEGNVAVIMGGNRDDRHGARQTDSRVRDRDGGAREESPMAGRSFTCTGRPEKPSKASRYVSLCASGNSKQIDLIGTLARASVFQNLL